MEAFVHRRWWLPGILVVAALLRMGAAVGLQLWLDRQHPPRLCLIAGDAEGYWDLAGDIATGAEYAVYEPPRRVLRMPGFPLCLALPRVVFGDRLLPVRLWLACLGSCACWGVWRLAADLVDETTAFWAALFAAVSPVLVAWTPLILSETTFALAMLLNLIAGGRLVRTHRPEEFSGGALHHSPGSGTSPGSSHSAASGGGQAAGNHRSMRGEATAGSLRWSILTGLTAALACYVRPSWLLATPLFGVGLLLSSRHRSRALRDVALMLGTLFLMLLPWGLRNQRVAGEFVLTTLWMGPSLYDGLNPQATGDSDMSFYDRDNLLGQGWSEAEVNRHYREAAWDFVREQPRRALELALVKLGRYWKPWPNAEQFRNPVVTAAVVASFLPLMVLAVYGGWLLRGRFWLLLLTAGPLLYFSAVHAVFVSSLRYRLPAEYPLLVLSAVGWQRALRGWQSRSAGRPGEGASTLEEP
jgi:4-amino-4-deoxy-L-arabinose transferase-like glycosyltransferase